MKNQTRSGSSQADPKLSFHVGFLVFVARGRFLGHGMLVAGIQISFPAHFEKGGGKASVGLKWFFGCFGSFFVSSFSIPEVK